MAFDNGELSIATIGEQISGFGAAFGMAVRSAGSPAARRELPFSGFGNLLDAYKPNDAGSGPP